MRLFRHLLLGLAGCSVDVEGEVACTNECDDERTACYDVCGTTCGGADCVATCVSGCDTTHGECTLTCTGGAREGRPSE